MVTPETHYTVSPTGLPLAYQVAGNGPIDIFYATAVSGTDTMWDDPTYNHVLSRLASMGRLICMSTRTFDSLGPGLGGYLATESWLDDVRAVLDEVGSTRHAAIIDGGPNAALALIFAATYPERVSSLVLFNSCARVVADDEYPIGLPPDFHDAYVASAEQTWGTGAFGILYAASRAGDESFQRWHARMEREALSPPQWKSLLRGSANWDARAVLPLVRVPTLVMHRSDCAFPSIAMGRYIADRIPGAVFKEVPGGDTYLFTQHADAILDDIEEFITGERPVIQHDRSLATILFTDIVSSTEFAARVGDRDWEQLVSRHDALVAHELDRYRGKHVKTTGDGVVATFDGPARGVRCAHAIVEAVRPLGIQVRAGLHTGEVELREHDIGGIAVHIGQRVSALAAPGEVLVSRTVTDLVAGSGLEFDDRGEHDLKGVPGHWQLYAVKRVA